MVERWQCCAGRDAASAGVEEHEEGDDATLEEASMTTVAKTRGRGERAAENVTPEAARSRKQKCQRGSSWEGCSAGWGRARLEVRVLPERGRLEELPERRSWGGAAGREVVVEAKVGEGEVVVEVKAAARTR